MATLHHAGLSSASYRVRIAFALKGVTPDDVAVDMAAGAQRQKAYLDLNPQGLVPSLVTDDGVVLTQSLAIIDWLERRHPDPPLLPEAPPRAQVLAFVHAICADLYPLQGRRLGAWLREAGLPEDRTLGIAWRATEMGLAACERLLARQSGRYCFGDRVTLADVCLVPQLRSSRLYGFDLGPFGALTRIEAECLKLPAFAGTVMAPLAFPDAPQS